MTVDIQIDSSSALTAHSMRHMISLTYILLAHFITNSAFALSPNSSLQKETERVGSLTVQFRF